MTKKWREIRKPTSLSWRASQAWLAGYSDGLNGHDVTRPYWSPDYAEDYERGRRVGVQRAELRAA